MITPDINNDISYYDLPKRKAVSLGNNNNMITPKINNNKECKARNAGTCPVPACFSGARDSRQWEKVRGPHAHPHPPSAACPAHLACPSHLCADAPLTWPPPLLAIAG